MEDVAKKIARFKELRKNLEAELSQLSVDKRVLEKEKAILIKEMADLNVSSIHEAKDKLEQLKEHLDRNLYLAEKEISQYKAGNYKVAPSDDAVEENLYDAELQMDKDGDLDDIDITDL